MLESLKDLYISYPFLPVDDKPAWFNHIKDVRLTIKLSAGNPILGYKNANNIRVFLTALDPEHAVASFDVLCKQYSDDPIPATANIISWEVGSPSTGNYVVIDSVELLETLEDVRYELNPDVLLFMQEAPVVYYGATKLPHTLSFNSGHNVTASLSTTGVALYGAAGGGTGAYTDIPAGMTIPAAKHSLGANSINGTQNMVWVTGAFPTRAVTETIKEADKVVGLRITYTRETT